MNCVDFDGERFVFQMNKREKYLLIHTLSLYPLIPPAHHRIATSGESTEGATDQQLLDEALAEQRKENKRQLEMLLKETGRFKEVQGGCEFFLNKPQIEWLLQVLNDVRIGSWLALGSPDEKKGKTAQLTEQNAQFMWFMEFAGYFQMLLLRAMHGDA